MRRVRDQISFRFIALRCAPGERFDAVSPLIPFPVGAAA